MLLLFTTFTAWACDDGTLAAALVRAEMAVETLRTTDFDVARQQADDALACMTTPVTPELAAAVHRVRAWQALGDREAGVGVWALTSMRAADPDHRWPPALVGPGHPLWAWDEVARTLVDDREVELGDGRWLVDGMATQVRPLRRPSVVQKLDAEGRVVETAYVPGERQRLYGISLEALWPTLGDGLSRQGGQELRRTVVRREVDRGLVRGGAVVGGLGVALLIASIPLDRTVRRQIENENLPGAGEARVANNFVFVGGAVLVSVGTVSFTVGKLRAGT